MPTYRQLTIRELLAFVLFVALAIAGLSTGGTLASIVIAAAIVGTTAFAIIAFVGRDLLRSFAIGFLIPVVAYSATILSVGKSELDPYEGMLPTTKLIKPVFELLVQRDYVDLMTNTPVPNYDPAADAGLGSRGFGGTSVGMNETPDRTTFMSLAHVLVAMICGYTGAKFAVWIDFKQQHKGRAGDEPGDQPKSR